MIRSGKGTYFAGDPSLLWADGSEFIVGKFCSIGNGLVVYLGGNHPVDGISAFPFEEMFLHIPIEWKDHSKGNVVIGNDVWIGAHVILMSGCSIGNGCVIGAHSVMRKSIPPYSIAYGNPCRVIRRRFSKEECSQLEEMKWWDWTDVHIMKNWRILRKGPVADLWKYYLEEIHGTDG